MLLVLQVLSMDIYAYPMGGFEKEKLATLFRVPNDLKPEVVIALGYLDAAEKLEEPYHAREVAARSRKELKESILES